MAPADQPSALEDHLERLLQSKEPELLEALGRLWTDAIQSADPQPAAEAASGIGTAITDDLKVVGSRIFKRWEANAYDLACGKSLDDARTRAELRDALHISDVAAAAALTSALVHVGLMPALATIVAAIIVKKFFDPAYGEFCRYWHETLQADVSGSALVNIPRSD